MAITKRKNRNGTASFQVRVHKPGADKQYVGTFRTEKEAKAAEKAAHDRLNSPCSSEMAFTDLAAMYVERAPVADQTRALYEGALRRFKDSLGPKPIYAITRDDIESALDKMSSRYKPGTVKHSAQVLKSCLYAAVDWGLLAEVPNMRKLRIKGEKHRPRIRVLTDAQCGKLVASAPDRARLMLIMGLATGLRRGELIGLDWQDLRDGCIHVERQVSQQAGLHGLKTQAAYRIVPVPESVLEQLEDMAGDGAMFRGKDDKRIGVTEANWVISVARTNAKLNCTWHDLRHTYASNLIRGNVDMKTVQYLMGHESIKTTLDIYGHLMPGQTKAAASALDKHVSVVVGTTMLPENDTHGTTGRNNLTV